MIKYVFVLFLLAASSGCVSHAVVPELEGRPRVPINGKMSVKPALQSLQKEGNSCYEKKSKA